MKFKVSKDLILEGLQKVQSVIGARAVIPILSNVLLKAENGRLWISATDLDVSVRCSMEATVVRPGATTLPARRILSIFRELPPGEIEVDVDDKDAASIKVGSSFFKILGLSEEEFPPLPKLDAARSYTIERGVFHEMLRHVCYAASKDDGRALLNGLLLSFKGDKLSVVTTDGRRMALMEQELEFPKECEADMVLPLKTVDELIKTLPGEGPLKIQATQNQIAFEFADMLILSKLVEGTYPNFRQVIPAKSEERVTVEREALLTALRRVAVMASDRTNSVKMSFAKNRLVINADAQDVGSAEETLALKYTGKPIAISFNPEFLMDPLKILVADEVHIELTDELCPGVVKSNIPFLYVLMPMKNT